MFAWRCLLLLWALALSPVLQAAPAMGMGIADARHLLIRAGFGATPETINEFARLSRTEAVARVLQATPLQARTPLPPEATEFIPRSRLRAARTESEEGRKALQRELVRRGFLLRGWWVEEMLAADTPALQLRERMVLFWHNHFVSSLQKVKLPSLMADQNRLFRQHALGSFDSLLRAAVKSPAMLVYLDAATSRKGEPNENLARELLELFTLGEGHYQESDVKEVARALTGWSIDPETGRFLWRRAQHDGGEKVVLGQRGRFDGDHVLGILLARPETAEFVVAKLWREFISPEPDVVEVKRLARHWRAQRYDTRSLLSAMFGSPAFWAPQHRGSLIKSPTELLIGTLHTFGNANVDGMPFAYALNQLGQDLFNPPNVKGWPGGEAWINSASLLLRKQLIERLLRSEGRMSKKPMASSPNTDKPDMQALKRRYMDAMDDAHIDAQAWQRSLQKYGLQSSEVLLALPEATNASDLRSQLLDAVYQLR